ncbi:MAG TPA: pyridoxal phosphate-dependent aminotransferase [Gemmata sp.]|nr:pyridoxal phosphate-dependent aminotransferase [Gemmata sp.]
MELPLWLTRLLIRTRLARFVPRARRLTDNGTKFLRYYSDRVLTAPVEELLDPAIVPDTAGPDIIDLNPPALRSESALSIGRFTTERWGASSPRGLPELRQAIAARYLRVDGRTVNPDTDILVTHGATGAFTAALETLVNPGDRVVLFDPCSPLFSLGARSRRAKMRWVTTWTEDGRLRFMNAAFEKAMRGAKLLVLANPGNPSGGCFTDEDLEYIAWIAAAYDVLIYADESFGRFHYADRGKSFGVLAGADRRILTAGSMTQEFGLGALRVGWLAGPRHLVRACGMMANLNAPFVPAVCQQAAVRALSEPDNGFTTVLDRLKSKRDYTIDRLRGMGLEPDRPKGGFFVWVPVAGLGLDGRTFAARLFREQQVQVGPGCAFGPGGSGYIRISFAAEDGRLREGLARMAFFIEQLKNPAPEMPVETETVAEKAVESDMENANRPKPSFSRV